MGIPKVSIYARIYNQKDKSNFNNNIDKEKKRNHYRQLWLDYRIKYPDATIKELHHLDSSLYRWLCRYDRDWCNDHKPSRKTNSKINWDLRDLQLQGLIKQEVKNILNYNGRPIRITMNRILSRVNFPGQKTIAKYPLTMKYLKDVEETMDDLYIRRICWAVQAYITKMIYPTIFQIRRLIALPRKYKSCIIDNEIETARKIIIYNSLYPKVNNSSF
jgi:hypothetical protein